MHWQSISRGMAAATAQEAEVLVVDAFEEDLLRNSASAAAADGVVQIAACGLAQFREQQLAVVM